MGKRNSTKTTVPTCLLPKGEHKQYIRGTVIFDGNKFYIKSRTGNFRLLPQGRIFICFSGNTSEEVLSVQNELLLENLRPDQIVEWQPMAWNAVGNISTFGEVGNAQNAIDKFADNADHIVFVVKDEIYEGLLHEWELWTSCPQGKKIYLFIYDNDNKKKIHDKLDSSKNIIYFPYKSSSDILVRLLREIQPELELSLENHKLSFVRTTSALKTYARCLKARINELKSANIVDSSHIVGLEKHLQFVERNPNQIISHNKRIITDITVEKSRLGHFMIMPIHIDTPMILLGAPLKTGVLSELHNGRNSRKGNGLLTLRGVKPLKK